MSWFSTPRQTLSELAESQQNATNTATWGGGTQTSSAGWLNSGAGWVNPVSVHPPNPAMIHDVYKHMYNPDPEYMIYMRMHAKEGSRLFEFMRVHMCSDKAVVFIVHQDQPIMIEDDLGLFPSDALISKLKLLLG